MTDADELYESRLHPYTQALLSAVPIPVPGKREKRIILKGGRSVTYRSAERLSVPSKMPQSNRYLSIEIPELKKLKTKKGALCSLPSGRLLRAKVL